MDIYFILHYWISHINHMHDIVFGGNQMLSGFTRSIVFQKAFVAVSQDKEVGYSLYVTCFSTYIHVLCYKVIETSNAFLHSGLF